MDLGGLAGLPAMQPLSALVLAAVNWTASRPEPTSCLSQPTFERLVDCLDVYTVPAGYYTALTYAVAQPTTDERDAWVLAVHTLLDVGHEELTCQDADLTLSYPNPLHGLYAFAQFTDSEADASFCVLVEASTTTDGYYAKGWGVLAVPTAGEGLNSGLHLSAPHPAYDLGTPQQAGALFKAVKARSLLIAGRSRLAYRISTDCIATSKGTNYKTDPAHDVEQPFFNASVAIYQAQMRAGGCPPYSCAFVQLHGKGASTCPSDDVFLSSGLGTGNSSLAWYRDATYRPVKAIKAALLEASSFPGWNISFPSDDPSCTSLTATTNVFGRYLNGVQIGDVCKVAATPESATGMFVHIEQNKAARDESVYGNWTAALSQAFAWS